MAAFYGGQRSRELKWRNGSKYTICGWYQSPGAERATAGDRHSSCPKPHFSREIYAPVGQVTGGAHHAYCGHCASERNVLEVGANCELRLR